MQLMADDITIDVDSVDERTQRWETVRINMKIGATTADNISYEDRQVVRDFFTDMPIVEPVDPRDPRIDKVRIVAFATTREGWEWCYATTRDGTFGVFSLDEPSRTFLEGATFHLWVPDDLDPWLERREDFTDLAEYQDAAISASLAPAA